MIIAFNENSDKYSSLTITEEQGTTLQRMSIEYDTALVRAHELLPVFYEDIKKRLAHTGLDITPLLDLSDVGAA